MAKICNWQNIQGKFRKKTIDELNRGIAVGGKREERGVHEEKASIREGGWTRKKNMRKVASIPVEIYQAAIAKYGYSVIADPKLFRKVFRPFILVNPYGIGNKEWREAQSHATEGLAIKERSNIKL